MKTIFRLLEPVIYFSLAWLLVVLLYTLQLSNLLSERSDWAWVTLFGLVFFYTTGYFLSLALRSKIRLKLNEWTSIDYFSFQEKAVCWFFVLWLFFIVIEVIYSGGIPIIWLIQGSSKGYADFGIPSVHGFINALQLSLTIVSYAIYVRKRKVFFLGLTLFFLIWSILMITRQVAIVAALEIFFIYMFYETNKTKILVRLSFWLILGILIFGMLGDIRTGADKFVWLAQPSENWPEWMPSGFLWVYMYLVTPLNNLLFNFTHEIRDYDFLFSNTNSLLFPSVIRNWILENDTFYKSGYLVTQAFNVSSSFTSPYIDAGFYGVALFAVFIGFFSGIFWWSHSRERVLYRSIIFQMLVLSIFYNHFFYLPVAFQLFFVPLLCKKYKLQTNEF